MEKKLEKVARQVLKKVGAYVDTVEPESLSPQTMKHITATLKDIRDLIREEVMDSGVTIRVEFGNEDWTE